MSSDSDFSDSENEDYEVCCTQGLCGISSGNALPFDPSSIEKVILSISDQFNFRVILNDGRARSAVMITTGLTLAGALIGRHYGGKVGAAVGGAVGGACGLGVVAVTMREIWQDIRGKLSELFEIVYDYLAGMGLDDYRKAAKFLTQQSGGSAQLAMVIMQVASDLLGKKIVSSLTAM
ncbi:unnamed protein product [Colias eurytheme]|nr:unnamed protein product [Colias eurytheme]